MSFTRVALAGGVLAAAAFTGTANATCVGTVVCEQSRPAATVCVYVGRTCTPVTVSAPLCIYGQSFQTVWC